MLRFLFHLHMFAPMWVGTAERVLNQTTDMEIVVITCLASPYLCTPMHRAGMRGHHLSKLDSKVCNSNQLHIPLQRQLSMMIVYFQRESRAVQLNIHGYSKCIASSHHSNTVILGTFPLPSPWHPIINLQILYLHPVIASVQSLWYCCTST